MLKRQETVRSSSSSHRQTETENRINAKAIGCMAGILQLVSKYQRTGKLLTFGNKKQQEKIQTRSRKHIVDDEKGGSGQQIYPGILVSPKVDQALLVVAEKRRKLLEALAKCDQDLKALKKIIEDHPHHHLFITQQPTAVSHVPEEEHNFMMPPISINPTPAPTCTQTHG